MPRLDPGQQNTRFTSNRVQTAAYDAHLPAKLLIETITRVLKTDCPRFINSFIPAGNNLQRVEKIVDIRRPKWCEELTTNSVDGSVATYNRAKIRFLPFQPAFKFPIKTFGLSG